MNTAIKYKPGPWAVGRGYRTTAFTAERCLGPWAREYLNAKGEIRKLPVFFRSEEGALRAIAKTTGSAS